MAAASFARARACTPWSNELPPSWRITSSRSRRVWRAKSATERASGPSLPSCVTVKQLIIGVTMQGPSGLLAYRERQRRSASLLQEGRFPPVPAPECWEPCGNDFGARPGSELALFRRIRRPHADVQLAQLLLGHGRRRIDQQVLPALRLGERDHVADLLDAGHQRHHPIEPESDASVRRGAVGERIEEEAELLALVLGRDLQRAEHLLLHLR